MTRSRGPDPLRRHLVLGTAAGSLAILARPLRASTLAAERPDVLRQAYGEREFIPGRLVLDLPALAENGNSVPLGVIVDAPMTAADYIRRIEIYAPANPVPRLIAFELTPQCGVASVEARIRLADSQRVWAIAESSGGTLYAAGIEVVVTLAACLDTFG